MSILPGGEILNQSPSNQGRSQLGVKVQGAEFVLERLSQCLKGQELVP